MKITTTPANLNDALKLISATVSNVDETTQNVSFHVEGGNVTLATTNYTGFSKATLDCSVEGESTSFSIEHKRLSMWLKASSKKAEVSLAFKESSVTATAKGSKSRVTFPSLSEDSLFKFPETLEEAQETISCKTSRLYNALKYIKSAVCKDESRPTLNLVECREGSLLGSDGVAMATLSLEGFEECRIKVQSQELGNLINFLAGQGEVDVSVREGDDSTHFVTKGAVFGLSHYNSSFPNFNPEEKGVEWSSWTVDCDELKEALAILSASADFDVSQERQCADLTKSGGSIRVEMIGADGKAGFADIPLLNEEETGEASEANAEDVDTSIESTIGEDFCNSEEEATEDTAEKVTTFSISTKRLGELLNKHLSDTITLDLMAKGGGGMLRVQTSVGEDLYSSYLAWMTRNRA